MRTSILLVLASLGLAIATPLVARSPPDQTCSDLCLDAFKQCDGTAESEGSNEAAEVLIEEIGWYEMFCPFLSLCHFNVINWLTDLAGV